LLWVCFWCWVIFWVLFGCGCGLPLDKWLEGFIVSLVTFA